MECELKKYCEFQNEFNFTTIPTKENVSKLLRKEYLIWSLRALLVLTIERVDNDEKA